jgi:hypothetical protein
MQVSSPTRLSIEVIFGNEAEDRVAQIVWCQTRGAGVVPSTIDASDCMWALVERVVSLCGSSGMVVWDVGMAEVCSMGLSGWQEWGWKDTILMVQEAHVGQ